MRQGVASVIGIFLAGFRSFRSLFLLPHGPFSSQDVHEWPEWTGAECPLCGGFTRQDICVPCASCIDSAPFFMARSLFVYEGKVREGIRAAKYARRAVPADALAERLFEAIRGRWSGCFPDGIRPVIVPVPVKPLKYFRRGFNLPALVGAALSRRTGWPFDPRIIERSGGDRPQAGLRLADREENVRGAFHVRKGLAAPSAALLIDDVFTSGATARECAAALKTAGSKNIVVLTVARAIP